MHNYENIHFGTTKTTIRKAPTKTTIKTTLELNTTY